MAPNEAASDGVAIPNTIDPRTVIINNIGGKNEEIIFIFSPISFVISLLILFIFKDFI